LSHIYLFVNTILFTYYTISTSYTNIHYTVFDAYFVRKKIFIPSYRSSVCLHVLAAFLCTSSVFPLINSILVSSVEGLMEHASILNWWRILVRQKICYIVPYDLSYLFFI
jgi:hypothetical protein